MTTTTTTEPATKPAPTAPSPVIADPAPVRELAIEFANELGIQTNVIIELLSIRSDGLARAAFRELRVRGKALASVLEMLPPTPGPDGCVVPGKPARGRMQ
jgi:hypothetical protein